MEWLAENWFWTLIGIAFVAMHLFGHGGHGGHKGGHDKDSSSSNDSDKPSGHKH
ncbi:DUF2933 domain-containing protein [Marinobacter sp.]|uniref:DUF2933 domain-containing protein n=1 Tax=Marinobacter sp. TaxID=50741 RepID=UPI001B5AF4EF|nr:DUF2933 domain-containing protein [Marinobacter sp.]MBQ0831876.1 DUF2933 domain-containing protein [Marinobacter sp.]